ncbi:unnamed protein product [Eruca vesicaria subsp. sativa]|uniref:Prolamin-like domain-containing protein n=1 Tax=Eruca vesicaria subsp. sativa TaxID=29727 RepID=A0ABC8JMV9_ERUVS|nr:unnamed protein product [Eruca vesicaria subsp. sativa]
MKNIILVLAMMIFFSSCVVTASEVESSTTNEELFRSGWFHPSFHPKPYVNPRKVFPGIIRCLSDKEEVSACFDYIVRSFYTGAECCEAINKMTQDCETVFGSFRNSFYTDFVKLHCSIVVGSTSPAPPSQPPSSTPSHAPLYAPSHAPLYAPLLAPSSAPSHAPSPSQGF